MIKELPSLPFPPEEPPPLDGKPAQKVGVQCAPTLRRVGRGKFIGLFVNIYHDSENPLFNGKQICECLGLESPERAYARLDDDEKVMRRAHDLWHGQQMVFITESGLYHLVFMSRKPEARAFRKWITSEVLPTLRRFGQYPAPDIKQIAWPKLTAEQASYLPDDPDVAKIGHRGQVILADRLRCMKLVDEAQHCKITRRCREISNRHFAREHGFSGISIHKMYNRYVASGRDWRCLATRFERSGRRKKIQQGTP